MMRHSEMLATDICSIMDVLYIGDLTGPMCTPYDLLCVSPGSVLCGRHPDM